MTRRSRKTLTYVRNKRRRNDDSFSSTDQPTPTQPQLRPTAGQTRALPATPTIRRLDFGGSPSPQPQMMATTPELTPHNSSLLYQKPCDPRPPQHPTTPPTSSGSTPPPILIPHTDVPLPPSPVSTPPVITTTQHLHAATQPIPQAAI